MTAKVAQSLCHRRGGEKGKTLICVGQLAMTRGVGEKGGGAGMHDCQHCTTLCHRRGGGGERHYTVEGNGRWVIALSEALRSCIIQPS